MKQTLARSWGSFAVLFFVGLANPLSGLGRPVEVPKLESLLAEADLVAVIRPLASTKAPDQLTSAGPKYGPRDPANYQALNTRCEVVLAMKRSEKLRDWHTNALTILHFRYAPSLLEFNGGQFIFFHWSGTHLAVVKATQRDGSYNQLGMIGVTEPPAYLAFLIWREDGRFEPVTGHYDSEPSFRLLATPTGGQFSYAEDDAARAKASKAEKSAEEKLH